MRRQRQKGQALIELALAAMIFVLLAAGTIAAVFAVRARSQAAAAAYACAAFLSQAPDPARAAFQAREAARRTLEADWTAAAVDYRIHVLPEGPGGARWCRVEWASRILFARLLGLPGLARGEIAFAADPERWKARWR
jgi:type II secretory pathway pseudopilin PulG